MHGMLSFCMDSILFPRLFPESDMEHKPIMHLRQQLITLNYVPKFKETHKSCCTLPFFPHLHQLTHYPHQHHSSYLPSSKMFEFISTFTLMLLVACIATPAPLPPPSPSVPKGAVTKGCPTPYPDSLKLCFPERDLYY